MLASDESPEAIAAARGFEAMDAEALGPVVDQADRRTRRRVGAVPHRRRQGAKKLTGFFVGLVMKATKGQADGKAVTALLVERAERAAAT